MIPYFIIFFIVSLSCCLSFIRNEINLKLLIYVYCVLLLILFSGLRHVGVGADDISYIDKFFEVPGLLSWIDGSYVYSFSSTWMEPGYIFISALIRTFTDDYIYLFLVISFFSIGIASLNYYRLSPFVYLTLLLFFVHTFLYRDINQIRSACAAALGLFLISQIYYRQHKKIIFTIFCCSLFHTASLSFLVVYFFSFIKITKKRLIFIVIVGFILGWLGVSTLLLSHLPGLGYISVKLASYSASSTYVDSTSLLDITNIKNLFIFFSLIFFWDRIESKVKYFNVMMLFFTLCTFWRLAFSDFGIFAARIATFFGIVEVILVPCLLLAFKNKIIPIIIIIAYAFTMLYINLFIKSGRFPYHLSIGIF
ncbi:EpsG family protein [Photobacterium piscicola]|uniref:EpsG family protein n=1 Tax=Photobacterium piscicola TaxID=1378299 RepID=A0ABU6LEU3_9GAMM|nr:EpsG family protein [Photobacterium piscicola]